MKTISHVKIFLTVFLLMFVMSGFNSVQAATVSVTSPNGGELWTAGTTNTITWTSDVTTKLKIVLLKNGVQYSVIAAFVTNTGSFNWIIPAAIINGTNYSVKIYSCINTTITDESDANFTISGGSGSTLAVVSPNGGETYTAGTTNTITWTSEVIGNVRILLMKNGIQKALIASAAPNTGSFAWLIPAGMLAGTDYTVKVISISNPTISDLSNATFSIIAGGGTMVTLTSPNGGEIWTAGTTNLITWNSDVTGNLRIVLLKNGIQYSVIAGFLPNTGSYSWTLPATIINGTDYSVKISSCINTTISDISDSTFSITGGSGSTLAVVSPNGGETYTVGTTNTITWTSDIVGNVRILLLKNGVQRCLIASSAANSGSFDWMIPSCVLAGTDYAVKIVSVSNPSIFDISDLTFSIILSGAKSAIANEELSNSELTIYPNPAIDYLTIASNSAIGHIMVFNSLGQIVLNSNTQTNQFQLNINDLTQGIYYVRIDNEGTTTTRKILKQ